jgi:sugar phosphate isomerase/epimerase
MENKLLVINTLVFLEQLKNGVPQSELLDTIHELGVKKAEIRREFIKNFESELSDIKNKASELEIELFYSVPEVLYKNGELQSTDIEKYFKEAFAMECLHVKMNIGEFCEVTSQDVSNLNKLTEQYHMNITVENDQSAANGKVTKIKKFVEAFRQLGGNLSVTFDIGNWIWQKEDPAENAKLLREYVTYIHLKDVSGKESPNVVLLNEGELDWKNIIDLLPQDVPLALEYPCGTDAAQQLVTELRKLKELN